MKKIKLNPDGKYTSSEIYNNRLNWIEFLQSGPTKLKDHLDDGTGARCCLGHACFITEGLEKRQDEDGVIYGGEFYFVPNEVKAALGLWTNNGEACPELTLLELQGIREYIVGGPETKIVSLSELNDLSETSPVRIGDYLESVIEGGKDTPFVNLGVYK